MAPRGIAIAHRGPARLAETVAIEACRDCSGSYAQGRDPSIRLVWQEEAVTTWLGLKILCSFFLVCASNDVEPLLDTTSSLLSAMRIEESEATTGQLARWASDAVIPL